MSDPSEIRRNLAAMRESAGIGRLEVERRCGFVKHSLRRFESKKTPLNAREQRMVLGVLRVLCEAEGCDFPNRMRRVREARNLPMHTAGKVAELHDPDAWKRIERDHKAPVIYRHLRVQLQAVLTRWEAELVDVAEAAE
jgi:hypothetical protein